MYTHVHSYVSIVGLRLITQILVSVILDGLFFIVFFFDSNKL